MYPKFTLTLALLLCWTSNTWARPLSLCIDKECDEAILIAEVTIVEVGKSDPAKRTQVVSVRVKVTDQPERIFKGFDTLGQTLEFKTCANGPSSLTEFEANRDSKSSVLIVVRANNEIILLGQPVPADAATYVLHSWYDWNAVIYSVSDKGKDFGHSTGKEKFDFEGLWCISAKEFTTRYPNEGGEFHVLTSLFLTEVPVKLSEEDTKKWIARLDADDTDIRVKAEAELIQNARFQIRTLVDATQTAPLEVKARIESVLRANALYHVAFKEAAKLRDGPVNARGKLLAQSYEGLTKKYSAQAPAVIKALKDWAKQVTPPVALAENASDAEVVKAWLAVK